MTQCADSIDTQFNVLFATWKKLMPEWYKSDTCPKNGCVCKEPDFHNISSQNYLWEFLFRDDCAPKLDATRELPHLDATPHSQLGYACVTEAYEKMGCLKDKLARWLKCPVQNKKGSTTECVAACSLPLSIPLAHPLARC
eukprot:6195457-Prymnesium_polylepis.1